MILPQLSYHTDSRFTAEAHLWLRSLSEWVLSSRIQISASQSPKSLFSYQQNTSFSYQKHFDFLSENSEAVQINEPELQEDQCLSCNNKLCWTLPGLCGVWGPRLRRIGSLIYRRPKERLHESRFVLTCMFLLCIKIPVVYYWGAETCRAQL